MIIVNVIFPYVGILVFILEDGSRIYLVSVSVKLTDGVRNFSVIVEVCWSTSYASCL